MTAGPDLPFALSPDAMQVTLTPRDGYLEAVVTGFKSPAGVTGVLVKIGQALRDAQLTRVLIDASRAVGQMSTSDHAAVGVAVAQYLGPVRCAVVARADRPRGEIAPAALAGGVDYRAFDELANAESWLLRDAGPTDTAS